jgi:hypothetical protein
MRVLGLALAGVLAITPAGDAVREHRREKTPTPPVDRGWERRDQRARLASDGKADVHQVSTDRRGRAIAPVSGCCKGRGLPAERRLPAQQA